MKLVVIPVFTLSLLMLSGAAGAKSCSGDPTALSRQHFASGSFDGSTTLTLPNGCKMQCQPGDSQRGTKRHCKWV